MLNDYIVFQQLEKATKENNNQLLEAILLNDLKTVYKILDLKEENNNDNNISEESLVLLSEAMSPQEKAAAKKIIDQSMDTIASLDQSIEFCLKRGNHKEAIALGNIKKDLIEANKELKKSMRGTVLDLFKVLFRFIVISVKVLTTNKYFYYSLGLALAGAGTLFVGAKFLAVGASATGVLNLSNFWTLGIYNWVHLGAILPKIGTVLLISGGAGIVFSLLSEIDKILVYSTKSLDALYKDEINKEEVDKYLVSTENAIKNSDLIAKREYELLKARYS